MAEAATEIFLEDLFLNAPKGYLNYVPSLFPIFIPSAPMEVIDWLMGYYDGSDDFAVGIFLELWKLPVNHNLVNLNKPVLIINGTEDIFAARTDILTFLDQISSREIQYVLQDGVGHGPFLEKGYKQFHKITIDFLSAK